jgi:hypothetical protein
MSDAFRIIPYMVRSAGTDVPPEEVQAAINSLATQTTIALNSVASDPTGPAGGDLGGAYPNPTVVSLHVTSGTESGVAITASTVDSTPVGATTPSTGAFTTLTATTPVGVASGGTGQNTLSAHNVLLGEGTSGVGFAAPGTAGQIMASNGAAVDPSFQTKTALGVAASGANSDITSLSGLTTPLSVPQGGTGRATLTSHGVLLGEGTSAINQTAAGTAGQALVSGGAGADPAFGITSVIGGGTGLSTLVTHSVLIGEGSGTVGQVGPGTTGQMLVGVTGADPTFGNTVSTLTTTGAITPSSTAGIVGTTTNDNANAGSYGEYLTNNTSATSLTSGAPANAVSVSLTAGDWDVQGVAQFNPAGSTTSTLRVVGINTVSATRPTGLGQEVVEQLAAAAGTGQVSVCPVTRISIASTTTVYVVVLASFSVSTMTVDGFIRARRVR